MQTVVGVFSSWDAAEQAGRSLGLPEDRVSVIAPERREPERTGIGAPLGGAVGAALGAATGSTLGTAAASLILPGVGPVLATGTAAALLLGAGGAAIGAAAGEQAEQATEIHPSSPDVFFYEEALRQGRAVVLALAETPEQAGVLQGELARAGAETLETIREDWWRNLRESERAVSGVNFDRYEAAYRRGFEDALEPANRGQKLEKAGRVSKAYRAGYERGQEYYRSLVS